MKTLQMFERTIFRVARVACLIGTLGLLSAHSLLAEEWYEYAESASINIAENVHRVIAETSSSDLAVPAALSVQQIISAEEKSTDQASPITSPQTLVGEDTGTLPLVIRGADSEDMPNRMPTDSGFENSRATVVLADLGDAPQSRSETEESHVNTSFAMVAAPPPDASLGTDPIVEPSSQTVEPALQESPSSGLF